MQGLDLGAEADRLAWLAPHVPVPEVLGHGSSGSGEWLALSPLPGRSTVDPRCATADADRLASAIGHGLRALHDRLPVATCPFDWSAASRLATVAVDQRRALGDVPEVDRLVVCHGDACAPNTIVDGAGTWVGHVDLGSLGVADRWADLAVASWSLEWNFGPGHEPAFFDAYGVAPDAERISFYRWLWDRS
ncbi:aminoglycoside 3'-phosphotransferase [Nocardioides panacisoli]|uniref:aminoglycoside 3'-phosphotransferase n=1 Tax=Nocardioides panacisoli TaxID=627624 RepID=UPI001C62DBF8|nr:aminoglycoside 3'-phosphotransferase [Nocardioides panacisoli]QYJ04158.1 aminoglycoside 3'-phosphotransferase [Nocardioides panacisoli]